MWKDLAGFGYKLVTPDQMTKTYAGLVDELKTPRGARLERLNLYAAVRCGRRAERFDDLRPGGGEDPDCGDYES